MHNRFTVSIGWYKVSYRGTLVFLSLTYMYWWFPCKKHAPKMIINPSLNSKNYPWKVFYKKITYGNIFWVQNHNSHYIKYKTQCDEKKACCSYVTFIIYQILKVWQFSQCNVVFALLTNEIFWKISAIGYF